MRLKAPPGAGDPCVAGITITSKNGIYDVDTKIGMQLVESFGFTDIDAPPKPKRPAAAPAPTANADSQKLAALRGTVIGTLKAFGISATSDAAMNAALGDLPKVVDARVAAESKAAEDRVLAQFADENAALKTRAETAEAKVAELEAKLAATPPAESDRLAKTDNAKSGA